MEELKTAKPQGEDDEITNSVLFYKFAESQAIETDRKIKKLEQELQLQ
jgi:hypothetical protein